MVGWYHTYLVETDRSAAVWALLGFIAAYAVTRWITRHIRARQAEAGPGEAGAIKDVYISGVHVHHRVWGILLVLVVGLLEFRFHPESPGKDILALLFGVGAALALDEFALWLHLEDVYWTDEGRKSIDAVMVAIVVGIAMLVSTSPVGTTASTTQDVDDAAIALVVVVHITFTVICLLKGKLTTGLVGLPIPFLGVVGAVCTAKPSSYWARRFYGDRKMAKAAAHFGERYVARHERTRDLFSGGRW